jgi:hypothetical protein
MPAGMAVFDPIYQELRRRQSVTPRVDGASGKIVDTILSEEAGGTGYLLEERL